MGRESCFRSSFLSDNAVIWCYILVADAKTQSPPSTGSGFITSKESNLEVWKNAQRKIYVPQEYEELQLRIFFAAHCGLGDHRGLTVTIELIKGRVFWTTMHADIKAFVQSCLVGILSKRGLKFLASWSAVARATSSRALSL